MKQVYYAHTTESTTPDDWEQLAHHLKNVAERTEYFSGKFGAAEYGYLAGLLHDLGKIKTKFQQKLHGQRNGESHAGEGAKFAVEYCSSICRLEIGRILAYCIAGHHAGLADATGSGGGPFSLEDWLAKTTLLEWPYKDELPLKEPSALPGSLQSLDLKTCREKRGYAHAFFTRMLFSCLVDADFLETERFYKVERDSCDVSIAALLEKLNTHMATFKQKDDEISILRQAVLQAARTKAQEPTGLFSLTVPTGGGKTLSSLAFALEHAVKHNLDRVIYVIPFTSIVEQTADVFREALKHDDAILEHHSAFERDKYADDDDTLTKLKQASENWDRPIVVTTAVQFFESLYANKTSRCRKLHNLAKSVIIFDEAQTIPLHVLTPCLAAIQELARGYGSSLVLCTATQPAVTKDQCFPGIHALEDVREIAPNPKALFEVTRRVDIQNAGTLTDGELVQALSDTDSGMVIVNNRIHALAELV